MNRSVRVLIVGDYPTVRADLRTVLELAEGIEVVGETPVGEGMPGSDARHLAQTTRPDIILIDLDIGRRMPPHQEPLAIIRQLKACLPGTTIIALSTVECPASPQAGLPAGIAAAFVKGVDTVRLIDTVRNFQFERERSAAMQQTSDLQLTSAQTVKPAALAQARATTRLAYIDTIRAVLIILVIMEHAAVTYGSLGDWTYEDVAAQDELSGILLSIFVIACQSFFMGLYFFFAGYFTPGAYDRKGLAQFWKERLLRLALPMVAYTWFLSKIPNYIDAVANNGLQMPFGQFFATYFWSDADEGPTWFLFALLFFSAGYTLWRLASQNAAASGNAALGQRLSRIALPTTRALLLVGLVMALFTFTVSQFLPLGEMYDVFGIFSLQFQFFPSYIILFAAGMLAYRRDWLARLPAASLKFWAWFSLALLVILPALLILGGAPQGYLDEFMSGLNWRCAAFSLWLGLAYITFSMALTLWLRSRVKPADRLAAFAGPNNYAVYLIHPLVLVPITWGLSYFALPALIKFALASVFTVALCFLFAQLLRRLPRLKAIL